MRGIPLIAILFTSVDFIRILLHWGDLISVIILYKILLRVKIGLRKYCSVLVDITSKEIKTFTSEAK